MRRASNSAALPKTAGTEGGSRSPTFLSASVSTSRVSKRRKASALVSKPEPVNSMPSESATLDRRIERRHMRRNWRVGILKPTRSCLMATPNSGTGRDGRLMLPLSLSGPGALGSGRAQTATRPIVKPIGKPPAGLSPRPEFPRRFKPRSRLVRATTKRHNLNKGYRSLPIFTGVSSDVVRTLRVRRHRHTECAGYVCSRTCFPAGAKFHGAADPSVIVELHRREIPML